MRARAQRARRWPRLLAKGAAGTLGVGLFALLVLQLWFFAHVLWWRVANPVESAFMARRLAELRARDPAARLEHRWVDYERISVHLKRAVVAAEDAKFIDHGGFDWEAIARALERNEKRGRIVAGASTVSQQLAKNLFLSPERSWIRKAQEAAITAMLEAAMSKRRILELYLNFAEWGENVFGAEAAARHHFGTAAAALTPEEAAWLAAILPDPRRHARGRTTPQASARAARILARMPSARIP